MGHRGAGREKQDYASHRAVLILAKQLMPLEFSVGTAWT
jgi:hypothetical protein